MFLASASGGSSELQVPSSEAASWTLRYPTLFSSRSVGDGPWMEALRAYEDGRLLEAMIGFDQVPEAARDADYLVYRAHFLLLVGSEAEARGELDKALGMAPGKAGAHALRAIMALREGRAADALAEAQTATTQDRGLPAAHLARSYAHQANRDLPAARASAEAVIQFEPDSALAHLRLAELDLAAGAVESARKRADKAVELAPALPDARNVLGFVQLGLGEPGAAAESFRAATRLNALEPAGHFGLGLAYVRQGKLEQGREQLEAAAKLAPANALPHTYLGRAYDLEGRDGEAGEQYALAMAADPLDPTPYRFDAIRLARSNAPVSARDRFHAALDRVDNRAVYRAPDLLAQDRALSLADISALDGILGQQDVAWQDAARAVSEDYASGAAHLAAGDALARLSRSSIAKQSEYLQALLRAPLGTLPPPLSVAEGIQPGGVVPQQGFFLPAAPVRTGYNEFGAVFNAAGPRFDLDVTGGNHDSLGDQFRAATTAGRMGMSLSQLYFRTDGFADYDGMENSVWRGVFQYDANPDTRLHLDYQATDGERKGVLFPDDPVFANPQAVDERRDRARIALRHRLGAGEMTWLASREELDQGIDNPPTATNLLLGTRHDRQDVHSGAVEVQYLQQAGNSRLIAGLSHVREEQSFTYGAADYDIFGPTPAMTLVSDSRTLTGYAYGQCRLRPGLGLEGGLSYDNQDFSGLKQHFLSPRLGLRWQAVPGGELRLAATRGLSRFFLAEGSLEPTSFAGFRVFSSDIIAMRSDQLGLGWSQRMAGGWDWGVEFSGRTQRQPLFSYPDPYEEWRERGVRAWLNRTLSPGALAVLPSGWQGVLSLAYDGQDYQRHEASTGLEQIRDYRPQHLRLGAKLFGAGGLGVDAGLTWVSLDGVRVDVFSNRTAFDARFPVMDLALNRTLPRRLGQVSVGAMNLFDRQFEYLEMDPANPRFAPERHVYARLRMSF
jgi:Tfp pilus assembly protein PilF